MVYWGLLALGCMACGRVGFAGGDDAGSTDATDASGATDAVVFPTGPFGAPAVIANVNSTAEEDDVSLTGDMLEIFFASKRTGTSVLWHATRASVTDPFSAPVEVVELGPLNNPEISHDGLTLYFADVLSGGLGMEDIWFATRADRSSPFGARQLLPGINTAARELEPWLLDNGRVLYLTFGATSSVADIARAERATASDAFGAPETIATFVTSSYDGGVWVDQSERVLMFHSERLDPAADIFISTRASTAEPWSTPVELTELNSGSADEDPWMSLDGHVMYFVSRRSGNMEIYTATR
jgi:hypothetical protein